MQRSVPSYQLYGEEPRDSTDFWIHCETIPVRTHPHNWEIARHRHDLFFQIFHLDVGHGEIVLEHGRESFVAPVVLFIPPGAVHGFNYSRDVDGLVVTALGDRLASIAAADRQIARFAEAIRIVGLPPESKDARLASESIRRLHGELASRATGRIVLLEALMATALVSLVRVGEAALPEDEPVEPRDIQRIETLLTLIAAHFREHRPVGFYADRLGISATHLNRTARSETGFSVQQLIARHMLDRARRELIFTPTPVQAIALSLGFADPAYFNRFFRKETGLTPGAFRRAERDRLAV
ncbi:helix-turn-helix domain-containing protein [Aquamicrobium sp. LC103]|uniref:helix-turn-helix domain-containing protein n=1 Tax=Aquamicrobium sp. LC103 TaxID=1120658 RepID=UPI00063E99A2|nr:helix-turn-helix domain-containing protein [Aquamicrobium sp. LC103]TKT80205.1 helix-turn-helix domain-containing protein [Aquamicrobium sp. LC103]